MKATEFLSSGIKVVLPTTTNPKVYLAIENSKISRQSFKLYNPFSKKAKVLKFFVKFLCIYCNPIAKRILPTVMSDHSEFIQKLKAKFDSKIHSSVYLATARDKFVLQLQNENGIIGYLKLAISLTGKNRILNEKKAIDILASLELMPKILFEGDYKEKPYIILENLEGTIGLVDDLKFKKVLDSFKKNKKHKLNRHPRVLQLIERLVNNNLDSIAQQLKSEIENSKKMYYEVYEHGDFAPWNLIEVKNKMIPFDFEYFEENGLEYLDEIKYHFQIGHLIHTKSNERLIDYISNKIHIVEFNIVFLVFLAKEIVNKIEENEPCVLENSLLKLLSLKAK